jgi:hypothetical protein
MMTQAELRKSISNLVEALIDILDNMDLDDELEPDSDDEEEWDQDIAPSSLNRDRAA